MDELVALNCVQIIVVTARMECFTQKFPGESDPGCLQALHLDEARIPRSLRTTSGTLPPLACGLQLCVVQKYGAPAYTIENGVTELGLLTEADKQGWRKMNLYGRTIYICPACRAKFKRTAPEWERRVLEGVTVPATFTVPKES